MNYKLRREKLYNLLGNDGILFLASGFEIHRSADECYPFSVNRNFLYLTGINQKNSFLKVDLNTKEETLYILDNDDKLARWIGYYLTHDEAKNIANINNVCSSNDFEKIYEDVFKNKKVFLDLECVSELGGLHYNTYFNDIAKRINPSIELIDIYKNILSLRAIKDDDEIKAIRHSIKVTQLALNKVMKELPNLKKEQEVQALFEQQIRAISLGTPAFDTIAGNEINSTTLHYHENKCDIKENSVILLDLGARVNFYNADITRTYPVNGKYNDLQKKIYSIVLKANKEIAKIARPGISMKYLQERTVEILTQGCLEAQLINTKEEIKDVYFHSVSHHLGLDVHDPMGRDTILEKGNVITDEPGLYFSKYAIGVRIEDDLLITEDGCEVLSKDIIKEIHDIEKYMEKES